MDIKKLSFSWPLLIFLRIHVSQCGEHEKALIRNLTTDYVKYARPVEIEEEAVQVTLGLDIQQVIDIEWHDYSMIWNPQLYGNVTQIRLPSTMVWTPDILLYNSANDDFNSMYPANVVVRHNGSMNWIPPGIIKASCKIDIKWFPFDDQKCVLKFGSWTYDMKAINLHDGTVEQGTYVENGEWKLVGVIAKRNQHKYACCPNPFVDVTFTIWTRRRTLYYGFNLIIPCVLISSMTLLGFTLPPDCGEKLTLGVTIFMSLCVFLLMVAEAMPQTSDAVPLIEIYFSCIMLVVTASVVFTVLVQNFHYRHPNTHQMPSVFRTIFLHWLPWMLMMKRPMNKKHIRTNRHGNEHVMSGSSSYDCCDNRQQSCSSLLPNAIEKDHYISRRQNYPFRSGRLPDVDNNHLLLQAMNDFATAQGSRTAIPLNPANSNYTSRSLASQYPPPPPPPLPEINSPDLSALWQVLHEIRYITDKMRGEEIEEMEIGDWKFAAMVVDRICLIIFTAFMLASTMAILFAAPHLLS